jgi:putative membrane protein
VKLVIRWVINAIALVVAIQLVSGIRVEDTNAWVAVAVTAIILGFVNAIIRPILMFLSCGFIVATLGLFTLVINAGTLWLSSWIARNWFDVGFYVDGFWAAFWGAIIVSVVSFLLSIFLKDD